jgi:hypothetical protein
MCMLTYAEEELAPTFDKPDSCCLGWMPDGESFIIRDNEEFCKTLLPRYFSQGKKIEANFTRNLYRWGFSQRRKINSNSCSYSHRAFKRGSTDYLKYMSTTTETNIRNCRKKRKVNEITHVPTTITTSSPLIDGPVPNSPTRSSSVRGPHSAAQHQSVDQQVTPDILQLPTPSSNIEELGALLAHYRLQQAVSTHSMSLNRRMDENLRTTASQQHGAPRRGGQTMALDNLNQERLNAAVAGIVASQHINASGIAALQSNLAGLQHNNITLSSPLPFAASIPFSVPLLHVQGQQNSELWQHTLQFRLLLITDDLRRANTNSTSI